MTDVPDKKKITHKNISKTKNGTSSSSCLTKYKCENQT